MYTPSQVAKQAGVTAQSIRNYSSEYAALLSPTASVTHGARLYTDEDMQILCAIADLRKAGALHDEIVTRIQDKSVPPIIDVIPQQVSNQAQEPSKAGQETTLALNGVLSTLNGRFEAIERRLDTRDREAMKWATLWGALWGAALALVAGGFFMLVLYLFG